MDRVRRIAEFLFYGSFFIAAAAASLAAASFLLFNIKVDLLLLAFIFFATLFSYNFARCCSFLPFCTDPDDALSWYVKNKKPLFVVLFVSGLFAVLLAFQLEMREWLFLLHLALIVLLYSWPIKGRCLRTVPCLKIVLIAYCWASVCVVLVLLHADLELLSNVNHVYLFLDRFLFIVAITLAFDIRDVACDGKDDLMTLPLLLSVTVCKVLGVILLVVVAYLSAEYLRSPHQLFFDLGVLFVAAFLLFFSNAARHDYYYLALIDGLIFFRAASLLL